MWLEPTHLGVTTGIVSDRSVGVGGEGNTECGEHADGRDANAIEAEAEVVRREQVGRVEPSGKEEGEDDGHGDRDHRDGRGDHPHAEAGDNDRGGTRLCAVSDRLRRLVRMRRVVFGRLADDEACHQPDDHGAGEAGPVRNLEQIEYAERGGSDQYGAEVHAEAERLEQLAHARSLLRFDGVNADDGENDADGGDQHGGKDGLGLYVAIVIEG